ncbi:MAG: PadR family transcriptional regulator [Bacteroidetes bacterium]|nr:MAG: PadR family transcriptional regulator [Bacteroidota bacterium]
MKTDDDLHKELLSAWEETYKKGQLTLWIFLSLKEGPKYVSGLQESIERFSKGTIHAEEQSLYRTLRKYYHLKMVDFSAGKGHKGPDRKYYHLTPLGASLLQSFVERNIQLFFEEPLKELLLNDSITAKK